MELYRKVRLACRDGMSERAAARHFGISRQSVRKMLEFSVPPGYRRTALVRRPKLDGFTGLIDEWLRRDRDDDHRKQRHTAKRISAPAGIDRAEPSSAFAGTVFPAHAGVGRDRPARQADSSRVPRAGGVDPNRSLCRVPLCTVP